MYVIKRTDQGGGFVAPPGSHSSYVSSIHNARLFETLEQAEAEKCPDNEVVIEFFPARVGGVFG